MSVPLLSVPRHNDKLADIEKRPKKIRHWLHHLGADDDDSARQILTVLYAQNRITMPLNQRLQNLESFYKSLDRIATNLFRSYRDMSIPLSANARAAISLLQRMHTELAYGYKLILLELSGKDGGNVRKIRLIAAIKSMKCLVNNLFYRYHSFAAESPGLWRDIHSIYRITGLAADDDTRAGELLSVLRQEYQTALLLHLAQPAGLQPRQLADTFELLRRWPVNHPKLQWLKNGPPDSESGPCDAFMLALKSSSGPTRIWSAVSTSAGDAIRFFNARPTLTALHQLTSSVKKGLRIPLLETLHGNHPEIAALLGTLITCWGKPPKRKHSRGDTSGSVFVCSGLSCLHNMLSRLSSANSDNTDFDYPSLSRWQIVNKSEGGMGIAHNKILPHGFQPGDLVGLMAPDSTRWQLGAVRWIRNDKRYEMGIQTLGDNIAPATLSHRKTSAPNTLFPALLASGKNGENQPDSIFVDGSDAHNLAEPLYLHCHDRTTRIRKPLVRSTLSYQQIVPRKPTACFRGA